MPFVARHIRLTNSGKLADIFLTSKVHNPPELTDAKLGKLFFVIQIDAPWNSISSVGSSLLNGISREYYRQEAHVPLENFERALAKANRLIDQLIQEGETGFPENLHAIIALVVGDEIHIAYTGAAEAYFLRDDKIGLITEPGIAPANAKQTFSNLITGEISSSDKVLLGSPGLYSAVTSDELRVIMKQPLVDAAKTLARRLKTLKLRKANAILIDFETLESAENTTLSHSAETIYLDQAIDSTWDVFQFNFSRVAKPVGSALLDWLQMVGEGISKGWQLSRRKIAEQQAKRAAAKPASETSVETDEEKGEQPIGKVMTELTERFSPLTDKLKDIQKDLPKFSLPQVSKDDVPVHHYTSPRRSRNRFGNVLDFVREQSLVAFRQLRVITKRSPRVWYIVIAFVILLALGLSAQANRQRAKTNPVVPAASLEEMKKLLADAKQEKAFGNQDKVRLLLTEAIVKGEEAKQSPKLIDEASSLVGQAQRDLDTLASATRLNEGQSLITLPDSPTLGTVFEGILYYPTSDGTLKQMLLTGGEASILSTLPSAQAINQMIFDTANRVIYLQDYSGALFSYSTANKRLSELEPTEGSVSTATGLGFFNDTLYLLDPAENEIWKHTLADDGVGEATAYLRADNDLSDGIGLAIDGSVFTLHKDGTITKFVRGNKANFAVTGLPAPFDKIEQPLGFFAVEDGTAYYLADKGSDLIPPRIIELDKDGKFLHQYFLPKKWQGDIRLVVANPKSHKAWVLVDKDLYEFTLVR